MIIHNNLMDILLFEKSMFCFLENILLNEIFDNLNLFELVEDDFIGVSLFWFIFVGLNPLKL